MGNIASGAAGFIYDDTRGWRFFAGWWCLRWLVSFVALFTGFLYDNEMGPCPIQSCFGFSLLRTFGRIDLCARTEIKAVAGIVAGTITFLAIPLPGQTLEYDHKNGVTKHRYGQTTLSSIRQQLETEYKYFMLWG